MEEIWKDIEGYEGLYQVSNLSRVRGLPITTRFGNQWKRHPVRILTPGVGKRGYYVVSLAKNGKAKTFTVHRLVAKAFIPNPNGYQFIDHIDTNKLNNSLDNLRWCTSKQNSNNPLTLEHNRQTSKRLWENGVFDNRADNITYRRVAQIDKQGNIVNVFPSIIEASKATGADRSAISAVCLGTNQKRHTPGGYYWRHIGERCKKQ